MQLSLKKRFTLTAHKKSNEVGKNLHIKNKTFKIIFQKTTKKSHLEKAKKDTNSISNRLCLLQSKPTKIKWAPENGIKD